jgi:hypothetical protein
VQFLENHNQQEHNQLDPHRPKIPVSILDHFLVIGLLSFQRHLLLGQYLLNVLVG